MSANNKAPVPTDKPAAYNAGDEELVAARAKKSDILERRRLEGLRKILADADSRLWLWDLISFCGVFQSSFTGNSSTFFKEGQRNVGLKLQGELTSNFPDAYVTMMKESK